MGCPSVVVQFHNLVCPARRRKFYCACPVNLTSVVCILVLSTRSSVRQVRVAAAEVRTRPRKGSQRWLWRGEGGSSWNWILRGDQIAVHRSLTKVGSQAMGRRRWHLWHWYGRVTG